MVTLEEIKRVIADASDYYGHGTVEGSVDSMAEAVLELIQTKQSEETEKRHVQTGWARRQAWDGGWK